MARHGAGGFLACGAVLAVTAAFLVYALGETRDDTGDDATAYRARFSSSDGIVSGSPVTLGGVVVGRVTSVRLDTESMTAEVDFDLRRDIVLATDTRLAVSSSGFGSDSALAVTPGHGPRALAAGALITDTNPAQSLQAAVGDYIFGSGLSSAQ